MTLPLTEYDLADFMPEAMRSLFENCTLLASEAALAHLAISTPAVPGRRRDYRVEILEPDFHGRLNLALGPGTGRVRIETRGPLFLNLRTWRRVDISIGSGTTISGGRMVCDHADIHVGADGLWSDDILIQSNDQHGIVDLETMELIGRGRRFITIGEHVWLGRRAIVLPDVSIGRGSILGTGAILTSDVPENAIFAGVPARLVRSNVSWSRSPAGLSDAERARLALPVRPDTVSGA